MTDREKVAKCVAESRTGVTVTWGKNANFVNYPSSDEQIADQILAILDYEKEELELTDKFTAVMREMVKQQGAELQQARSEVAESIFADLYELLEGYHRIPLFVSKLADLKTKYLGK